jgi:hypothetical protein
MQLYNENYPSVNIIIRIFPLIILYLLIYLFGKTKLYFIIFAICYLIYTIYYLIYLIIFAINRY